MCQRSRAEICDLSTSTRKIGLANLDEYYYGETMRKMGDAVSIARLGGPEIAPLAGISMTDFLRQHGASPDAIHYLLFGFEEHAALDFSSTGRARGPPLHGWFCRRILLLNIPWEKWSL